MAGQLTIDTLKASSGVLATQNGMTGIAKAWVNFNGTGTVAIRSAFNVSSITDNGTGNYTVNFTTAMSDANYSYLLSRRDESGQGGYGLVALGSQTTAPTTTALTIITQGATSLYDCSSVSVAIFGN